MRLEDMNVLEKAAKLEALIAQADLDPDYSIQVAWMGSQGDSKRDAKVLIDNTRNLFQQGKLDALDMDVRAEAFNNYNTRLDAFLQMFPEYAQTESMTEGVTQRHM